VASPSLASAASTAFAVALVALGTWIWVVPEADRRAAAAASTGLAAGTAFPVRLRTLRARITGRIGLGPASRRRQAQERLLVIRALGALAAELESGQPIGTAMRRAGGDPSVWPVSVGALKMDGDVASALATDAFRHPVLQQLAACWQVGADSGAGLAAAVARLAASARSAEDVRVDLEGQLAGPRASARMLAVLPFVGIGFGMMLGSDPLAWLLTSVPGRLCLLAGVTLTALGTWWTGRIARRVERML
jgi:tight adherence protein B